MEVIVIGVLAMARVLVWGVATRGQGASGGRRVGVGRGVSPCRRGLGAARPSRRGWRRSRGCRSLRVRKVGASPCAAGRRAPCAVCAPAAGRRALSAPVGGGGTPSRRPRPPSPSGPSRRGCRTPAPRPSRPSPCARFTAKPVLARSSSVEAQRARLLQVGHHRPRPGPLDPHRVELPAEVPVGGVARGLLDSSAARARASLSACFFVTCSSCSRSLRVSGSTGVLPAAPAAPSGLSSGLSSGFGRELREPLVEEFEPLEVLADGLVDKGVEAGAEGALHGLLSSSLVSVSVSSAPSAGAPGRASSGHGGSPCARECVRRERAAPGARRRGATRGRASSGATTWSVVGWATGPGGAPRCGCLEVARPRVPPGAHAAPAVGVEGRAHDVAGEGLVEARHRPVQLGAAGQSRRSPEASSAV